MEGQHTPIEVACDNTSDFSEDITYITRLVGYKLISMCTSAPARQRQQQLEVLLECPIVQPRPV